MTIHAPLLALTKRDIIARGIDLGVDFGMTLSCYDPAPDGVSCGRCDACRLGRVSQCSRCVRVGGFAERVALPARIVHAPNRRRRMRGGWKHRPGSSVST